MNETACETCGNWKRTCICPLWNDADSMTFHQGDERVVAAAVRSGGKTYAVRPPARHHHVIRMMRLRHGIKCVMLDEQGFLLSNGRFVDRDEALCVARTAGQLKRLMGGVLTSEDLW